MVAMVFVFNDSATTAIYSLSVPAAVTIFPAVGVKVAVQVTPPSEEETAVSVPLATVKSALSKPVTASLKVMVKRLVSPKYKSELLTPHQLAVGLHVSINQLSEVVVPVPAL